MEKLKILQKWEDMAEYAYILLRNIPKSERFTLGAEIRSCIWKGMSLIVKANHARNKRPYLVELDAEIKVLLGLSRIAFKLHIIPIRKYERFSGMLVELGKMTGGWFKFIKG
jgi:hypothetical protein